MASHAVLQGVGTLVCFGERFPDMHYTMSIESDLEGNECARGMIETLPQRASVQIELEGSATLELQSGEAIGITFQEAALRRLHAEFIAVRPTVEA